MRIIAGQWRGLKLASLGKGDSAAQLRPTADRVRESLFSMLSGGSFGNVIIDARVLDLFAGTGALALEALSRGAETACLIESGRRAIGLIEENMRLTKAGAKAVLLRRDATRLPLSQDAPASLVFLDPPYGRELGARALASARAGGWIAPGALVVWEEAAPQEAPEGFARLDTRRYGDTHVTLLEHL